MADLALEKTEMLAEQGRKLPEFLTKQIETNRQLFSRSSINRRKEMSELTEKRRLTTQQTQQVRQTLTTIRGASPMVKVALRH